MDRKRKKQVGSQLVSYSGHFSLRKKGSSIIGYYGCCFLLCLLDERMAARVLHLDAFICDVVHVTLLTRLSCFTHAMLKRWVAQPRDKAMYSVLSIC